jgi:alpha-glucosidase
LIEAYEGALPRGGWPNWVLGNHDRSRVASRIGPDQARVAAMLLLTLRGTPTLYQGEEIGMTDVPIPPERVQDPWEKNVPGLGLGRDPARTSMPWGTSLGAGFTTGEPWLPLGADHAMVNVAAQAANPHSMLSLYRALLFLRQAEPALSMGTYIPVRVTEAVLVYERQHGSRRLRVALNMSAQEQGLPDASGMPVLLSTYLDRMGQDAPTRLQLRPGEGVVLQVGGKRHRSCFSLCEPNRLCRRPWRAVGFPWRCRSSTPRARNLGP